MYDDPSTSWEDVKLIHGVFASLPKTVDMPYDLNTSVLSKGTGG